MALIYGIFLRERAHGLIGVSMQTAIRHTIHMAAASACLWLVSCAAPKTPHVVFTEREDYPKTSDHFKDVELYKQVTPETTHLKIDTSIQRGFLMHGEKVVIDYPICSGRSTHPTPKGVFKILEKKEEKVSNRYGRIYDAEGNLVNGDADIRTDEVPEGGKFVGAPMPFWMRLSNDGIGHHIGPTLRRPSSHGCIRGPKSVVPLVFAKVEKGTKVYVDEVSAPVNAPSSVKDRSTAAIAKPSRLTATQ